MSRQSGEITLPDIPEAIATISQFTELDVTTITDYLTLAGALGGMSAALSAVALDYGEKHQSPGIRHNAGLRTHIGEGPNKHVLVVSQDAPSLEGASIRRHVAEGNLGNYSKCVNIPTDEALQQLQAADPLLLQDPRTAARSAWKYVHATATTTNQGFRVSRNHWPFHLPVSSRPGMHQTIPREDAIGYTQILQDLSRAVLEVVQ